MVTHPKVLYSRIPKEFLYDRTLSPADWRVYSGLQLCGQRGRRVVHVGMLLLAEYANLSRLSVRRAINHLIDRGHIARQPRKPGARSGYVFLSPIFAAR